MNFSEQMRNLETQEEGTYVIQQGHGKTPVILTAAHTIQQHKYSGKIKVAEPFTKAIAKYVGKKTDSWYFVKTKDTGVDPNCKNHDEFKTVLIDLIRTHHIKLLIDIHGSSRSRDYDVEIGTLDGRTINQQTLDHLTEILQHNGIKNIAYNCPFKGGDITKTIFQETQIDVIQLEINCNFLDLRQVNNLRKVCKALTEFIKNYRKTK